MIRFHCKNCGQKIHVPEIHAGKKGKCPKCKNVVIVPKTGGAGLQRSAKVGGDLKAKPKSPEFDLSFLDIPKQEQAPKQPTPEETMPDEALDDLWKLRESMGIGTVGQEPAPERKYPWLIDIFFYPLSKAGLTTIGIIIGIPLIIGLMLFLFGLISVAFPPMLVFVAAGGIIGWIVNLIIKLFAYWYLCEAIRDSADGGIRAPETIATTPGLGELIWQAVRIVACLAFFAAPAVIYSRYTGRVDGIYWCLVGCAVFFFPMGLLAVVMFDSISGLNPILLIGSVLSTFFPYFGLVLLYAVGVLLYIFGVLVQIFTVILSPVPVLGLVILPFLLQFFSIYVLLIAAHLLGRFYFRYEEKLNWDV